MCGKGHTKTHATADEWSHKRPRRRFILLENQAISGFLTDDFVVRAIHLLRHHGEAVGRSTDLDKHGREVVLTV